MDTERMTKIFMEYIFGFMSTGYKINNIEVYMPGSSSLAILIEYSYIVGDNSHYGSWIVSEDKYGGNEVSYGEVINEKRFRERLMQFLLEYSDGYIGKLSRTMLSKRLWIEERLGSTFVDKNMMVYKFTNEDIRNLYECECVSKRSLKYKNFINKLAMGIRTGLKQNEQMDYKSTWYVVFGNKLKCGG